ncbi:phosphate signaling complex protein PhoU [Parathermosynechococcus lividus]
MAPFFERQLQRLRTDLLRLGALVETTCQLSYGVLIEGNLTAIDLLLRREQEVDRQYRQLTQDTIEILTLHAPVANDLRFLASLLHLSRDLERISDYAVEIASAAQHLFAYPATPSVLTEVKAMFERSLLLVSESLSAVADLDVELAAAIALHDDAVDADYSRIYSRLCSPLAEPELVEPRLLLLVVIRNLERMGDHATKIGEQVCFIVNGYPH